MPLTRDQATPGAQLHGCYKGEEFDATVIETEQGLCYRLADGREFRSPSGAARAVMSGISCNGWRFWSLSAAAADASGKAGTANPKPTAKSGGAGSKKVEPKPPSEAASTSA